MLHKSIFRGGETDSWDKHELKLCKVTNFTINIIRIRLIINSIFIIVLSIFRFMSFTKTILVVYNLCFQLDGQREFDNKFSQSAKQPEQEQEQEGEKEEEMIERRQSR